MCSPYMSGSPHHRDLHPGRNRLPDQLVHSICVAFDRQ